MAELGDTALPPQDLFKEVMPYQCLGSLWSQRDKPGKEYMTSTVCAAVAQFNRVAKCVMTTCLGDPGMRAQDRAKVVEHWVKVAKVCDGRPSGVPVWSLIKCLYCFVSSQD